MDKTNVKPILQETLDREIPPSEIQLWPNVQTNVNKNRSTSVRSARFSRYVMAAFIVMFLVIAALFTPPGQALAQEVIRRIGNFIITSEATDAENYVATLQSGTPTPTPDPNRVCLDCPLPVESGRLSLAQVSEKAGFPVYGPKYVPVGYQLSSRDVLFTDSSITAHMSYRMELDPPLHDGLQLAGIIAISQTQVSEDAKPWEKGVGDVPIVDVTVRGQPGVWLEQVPVIPVQDPQGEWDYARWNQLIWAEDGYNFMLQANMPSDILPLTEMLKIAESLKP